MTLNKSKFRFDEGEINRILAKSETPDSKKIDDILAKARELKGLSLIEAASLLNVSNNEDLKKIFETAHYVKNEIYGKRLVLFAPLYASNFCSNNCLYCGFRSANKSIKRKTLSFDEIRDQTREILRSGHKRILLLTGESAGRSSFDYLLGAIESVYSARDEKNSSIRRINVEIAPLDPEKYRELSTAKIGTYTVFQETYKKDIYEKMHLSGPKADFDKRFAAPGEAFSGGLRDVGIGALFGLSDYRFETLSLLKHAAILENEHGVGPHTISIPRIKFAAGAPAAEKIPARVSDENFKKLTAVIRCALPYVGIILSTREPAALRSELYDLGVSQISAGSRSSVGGYKSGLDSEIGQFSLDDCRSSGEVIEDAIERGFIPSFCTACYRLGRVGADFMDQAKPGLIKLFCQPNALLTLKEYLIDYGDEKTRIAGEKLIERELEEIPDERIKRKTIERLDSLDSGKRDLYF